MADTTPPVERISAEHKAELSKRQRAVERLQAERQKLAAQLQKGASDADASLQEAAADLALFVLDLREVYKVDPPDGIEPGGIIRRQS